MNKKSISVMLCFLLILSSISSVFSSARVNPPRDELEKKIEEVARRKGIPSVILKSIARVESVYQQYRDDGSVYTGPSGSIGLMQIYNRSGRFDDNRLRYDIDYNIEASAEILLEKWAYYGNIGDMDPNVLENWYFAIWAYNGWSSWNNPNAKRKTNTYQDLVYMIAKNEYGQDITKVDSSLLPSYNAPSRNIHVDAPKTTHLGDIITYGEGDIVTVDVNYSLPLMKNPSETKIADLKDGTNLVVLEGPVLKDKYYWYKVRLVDSENEGWVKSNWIYKTDSIYPLKDIGKTWAKDYILNLHDLGIVNGDLENNFNPDRVITRQEMAILITKVLDLDGSEYKLDYSDKNEIAPWALDSVKAVTKVGIINGKENNIFNPLDGLTKEEMAVVVKRMIDYKETSKKEVEEPLEEESEEILEEEQEESLNELGEETKKELKAILNNDETTKNTNEIANNEENTENLDIDKDEEVNGEVTTENLEYLEVELEFDDIGDISPWAIESVKYSYYKDIIVGSNINYNPQSLLTKAQTSKILSKIIEVIDQQ